jgi:hypothetical protein
MMSPPTRPLLRLGWILMTGAAAFAHAVPTGAQEARIEAGGWSARVVDRDGTAVILEAEGPALDGPREFFYRPSPPFDVSHRWILVQDSTFGVVFSQPSGVKGGIGGYVGDLYLLALENVRAVEVRALIFNVWGEFEGQLAVTVLVDRGGGERWEIHPTWSPASAPLHEHRTSILWINRVMFDDEAVVEADMAPVAGAWEHVTGSDFDDLGDVPLLRAVIQ